MDDVLCTSIRSIVLAGTFHILWATAFIVDVKWVASNISLRRYASILFVFTIAIQMAIASISSKIWCWNTVHAPTTMPSFIHRALTGIICSSKFLGKMELQNYWKIIPHIQSDHACFFSINKPTGNISNSWRCHRIRARNTTKKIYWWCGSTSRSEIILDGQWMHYTSHSRMQNRPSS